MSRVFKTILFLFACLAAKAQTFTVETVPNIKLVNNSYVSDPGHILYDTTVSRINKILGDLESKATAQIAVVLLPSIGDQDRFEFAQHLFEHWKIGTTEKDNGLLILFILDQRNIRFHTGFGLEGLLSDARCKQIQQEFMVPFFKEGDYNSGMLRGIEKVNEILTTPEAVDEIFTQEEPVAEGVGYIFLGVLYFIFLIVMFAVASGQDKFKGPSKTPQIIITRKKWFFLYGLLPIALFAIGFQFVLTFGVFLLLAYGLVVLLFLERYQRIYTDLSEPFIKKGNFQALHSFYQNQNSFWLGAAIFFFIPMIFVYQAYKKKRNWFRDRPRPCKKCGAQTQKMSEKTEDAFLNSGQIMEEKLKVTDFDVWKCDSCGATEILSYSAPTTNYSRCPKCKYITYHLSASRTIESATYSSKGHGEEEHTCKNCGHHDINRFTIAMLVAAASSSDSSSSSWDSSSSSSDSGGSWGGGDSGGGGSDSSW